jgi:CBS domain-containing protein
MLVKDLMNKPKVIEKDIDLSKAARLLKEHDIASLIMMNKNKIMGIITEDDLTKNFGRKAKVSKIMTKKVITVPSTCKVSEAITVMKENGIGVLPVVDKRGHLIGVLAAKDLLFKAYENPEFLLD